MSVNMEQPYSTGKKPPVPQCTPVKASATTVVTSGCHSVDATSHRTPLSRINQLFHGGVHHILTASSPRRLHTPELSAPVSHWPRDVRTPECNIANSRRNKDTGLATFRTPLSVAASSQNSMRYFNPFESGLLDTLHQPVFSPNVFKTSTPGSAAASLPVFQWTIDEIAILKPANIETPHHDLWLSGHNSDVEERAQKAIDSYFSSNVIVPSPWTDSAAKRKHFRLPQTPGCEHHAVDSPMIFSTKAITGERSPNTDTKPHNLLTARDVKQVAVQTVITIPADIDLEGILGEQYRLTTDDTANDCVPMASVAAAAGSEDDIGSQDILSNSSLRRKLFFHGEDGTPISPVRHSTAIDHNKHEDCDQPLSPDGADSMLSDQFSSSPLRMLHTTPTFRRCSTAPQLIDSPAMSPINSCYYTPAAAIGTAMRQRDRSCLETPSSTTQQLVFGSTPSHLHQLVLGASIDEPSVINDSCGFLIDDNSSSHMICDSLHGDRATLHAADTGYQSNISHTATGLGIGAGYQPNNSLTTTGLGTGIGCHPLSQLYGSNLVDTSPSSHQFLPIS